MRFLRLLSLFFLSALLLLIVLQISFFSEAPYRQNVDAILMGPGKEFWFGTDSLGRSLFWRIVAGAKVSLVVGLVCPLVILTFGSVYGFLSGWWGGWQDRVMMRICDIFIALPSFLLVSVGALFFAAFLPLDSGFAKSLIVLCLGISSTHWMLMARIARAKVLELRARPFVEAARALGGTPQHILHTHLWPNTRDVLLVTAGLQIPTSIVYESFMSFVGLGIQAPQTSWGILIKEGWQSLSSYPHLILLPSLVLFLAVWSLHLVLDQFMQSTTH